MWKWYLNFNINGVSETESHTLYTETYKRLTLSFLGIDSLDNIQL